MAGTGRVQRTEIMVERAELYLPTSIFSDLQKLQLSLFKRGRRDYLLFSAAAAAATWYMQYNNTKFSNIALLPAAIGNIYRQRVHASFLDRTMTWASISWTKYQDT